MWKWYTLVDYIIWYRLYILVNECITNAIIYNHNIHLLLTKILTTKINLIIKYSLEASDRKKSSAEWGSNPCLS